MARTKQSAALPITDPAEISKLIKNRPPAIRAARLRLPRKENVERAKKRIADYKNRKALPSWYYQVRDSSLPQGWQDDVKRRIEGIAEKRKKEKAKKEKPKKEKAKKAKKEKAKK